jgi:prevent-host-death family protein
VLWPLTEHGRYDLALDLGSGLLRVQCKWGTLSQEGTVISVRLGQCRCAPSGYVRNTYDAREFDLLGVYCRALDRCYLLPSALGADRTMLYLRLAPPKNRQRACITMASEYELDGAVAQLGERRHGMAEVRGSSPLSSIDSDADDADSVIGTHELRERLGHHLDRAAAGESLIITRRGRRLARLGPISEPPDPPPTTGA